jgi:hypothetical protein
MQKYIRQEIISPKQWHQTQEITGPTNNGKMQSGLLSS